MRSIADLFKDSWGVFTKVWLKYLGLYLVTVVGVIVLIMVTFGSVVAKGVIDGISQNPSSEVLIKMWPMLAMGFVLLVLFASFVGLAINKVVYSQAEGTPATVKESFKYSFPNFLPYLLVSFVTGLLVFIGFLLLIVPGIYALTVLSMVPMVFVLEEKHGLEALTRSRELVRGYFWPVFGRIFLLGLVGAALSALTNKIPLVSLLVSFVFGGISIAYSYFIYKDLVALKKA